MFLIFDIETNGLLKQASKIHCLSYQKIDNKGNKLEKKTLTEYQDIVNLFVTLADSDYIVGHNIIRYDIPVLEKILNLNLKHLKVIDTLGLSFYHYPVAQFKHGLEEWGERFGVAKPKIADDAWDSLPIEEYIHRCEEDVKINTKLFEFQWQYTNEIYDGLEGTLRLINYINFILTCLRDQEEVGITLNKELATNSMYELEFEIEEKIDALSAVMPEDIKYKEIKKPDKLYKKDNTLTVAGQKWFILLKEQSLPETHTEPIKIIASRKKGNPASHKQLKDWLFTLGWEPATFKENDKGEEIPQVSLPFGGGLCSSVLELIEKEPVLEHLKGLYRARHRLGLFKAYLDTVDENGKVYSTAHGLAASLRLTHSKPIVNLPGVGSYYGEEIRGCLTVPSEDYIFFGSDLSGLESATSQHYIYFYDPEYVKEMRVPGYDAHTDIAVLAKLMTKEEEKFFKESKEKDNLTSEEKEKLKALKKIRSTAKTINFSAVYGAGPPKIAKTLRCTLKEAKTLHEAFWTRNKAIKQATDDFIVKKVRGQEWIYCPVSRLWLFLRNQKDKFSVINQHKKLCCINLFNCWKTLRA